MEKQNTNHQIVKDFMTKNLITLNDKMDIFQAIDVLIRNKISGAPVLNEDGVLVGMLSEKDCLKLFANESFYEMPSCHISESGDSSCQVKEFMTEVVTVVHPATDLFTVADNFLHNNIRRIPVLENETLVGQISRRDVLRAILDASQTKIIEVDDNGYLTEAMKSQLSD
jgi:CBS domain-containing protein